jgi:hypothetical protein
LSKTKPIAFISLAMTAAAAVLTEISRLVQAVLTWFAVQLPQTIDYE